MFFHGYRRPYAQGGDIFMEKEFSEDSQNIPVPCGVEGHLPLVVFRIQCGGIFPVGAFPLPFSFRLYNKCRDRKLLVSGGLPLLSDILPGKPFYLEEGRRESDAFPPWTVFYGGISASGA